MGAPAVIMGLDFANAQMWQEGMWTRGRGWGWEEEVRKKGRGR